VISGIREVIVDRSAADGQFDGQFSHYAPITVSPEDRRSALELVDIALRPAPKSLILAELARLRLTTKARPECDDDLRMMAAVYAENIADYPSDVVVDALRNWARYERFWPSWAELRKELEALVKRRRSLRATLARRSPQSRDPVSPETEETAAARLRERQEVGVRMGDLAKMLRGEIPWPEKPS
jgi:hypothetical protein